MFFLPYYLIGTSCPCPAIFCHSPSMTFKTPRPTPHALLLPRLQSNTKKKKQDNGPCKWWDLRFFYLVNYLIGNWTRCPAIFCHPSIPDLHSPPHTLLKLQFKTKRSRTIVHPSGDFFSFIFHLLINSNSTPLTYILSPCPSHMNYKPCAPLLCPPVADI